MRWTDPLGCSLVQLEVVTQFVLHTRPSAGLLVGLVVKGLPCVRDWAAAHRFPSLSNFPSLVELSVLVELRLQLSRRASLSFHLMAHAKSALKG